MDILKRAQKCHLDTGIFIRHSVKCMLCGLPFFTRSLLRWGHLLFLVACSNSILTIYCSMWSKVNLSWQQLLSIAHKLKCPQASTESNKVAESFDALSYRGNSRAIVPICKNIGFIGVMILYLEFGVCCLFPSCGNGVKLLICLLH